jgi:hypothetical protein
MFTLQGAILTRRITVIVFAIVACFVLSGTAQASIIGPGDSSSTPDIFVTCCGTLVASSGPQTFTSADGNLTFTFNSAVYRSDTICAGCLNFLYQVTNSPNSIDAIGRVVGMDFSTWFTDAGYTLNGSSLDGSVFVDGNAAPLSVDRSALGDTVGFGFFQDSAILPPGSTSRVLVIQTNATNYSEGFASIYSAASNSLTTIDPYQPSTASAVPEPGSLTLLGIGLLAGIGSFTYVRIRRSRASV